jgi:hypothetical protein
VSNEPRQTKVLEQILAWAGSDDKTWLAHVINSEGMCGCQNDQDGFHQFCEAWQLERDRAEHMAELKIRGAGL